MSFYVQYHNCDKKGLAYLLSPGDQFVISTRRPNVKHAQGTVLVIVGVGRPRQFFLWEAFDIEGVDEKEDGTYTVYGPGWQLSPPQQLLGPDFGAFKDSCGNFVSFRSIDSLPYSGSLKKLATKYRAVCPADVKQSFLQELLGLLKDGTDNHGMVLKLLKQRPEEPKPLEEEVPGPKLAAPAPKPTKERSVPQQGGESTNTLRTLSKIRPGPARVLAARASGSDSYSPQTRWCVFEDEFGRVRSLFQARCTSRRRGCSVVRHCLSVAQLPRPVHR